MTPQCLPIVRQHGQFEIPGWLRFRKRCPVPDRNRDYEPFLLAEEELQSVIAI